MHVERFGVEALGLERPAHLLPELIAHLPDGWLRLFAELRPDPVAGLPLGHGLGLGLALGNFLAGDPADEPLAEASVDPQAGDGRVGVGRGLDGRRRDVVLVEEDPPPGVDRGDAAAVDRDRPLRSPGVGDVRGPEDDVEHRLLPRRHEVEADVAGGVPGAADPRSEDDVIDRLHLVDRAVDGRGKESLGDFEVDVGAGVGSADSGHDARRLPRIDEPIEDRRHRRQRLGLARGARREERRGELVEPVAELLGTVAAGDVGDLGILRYRLADADELRHVETHFRAPEFLLEIAEDLRIGRLPRRRLGLERRPIEIRPPIGPALAPPQQGVERQQRRAKVARRGVERGITDGAEAPHGPGGIPGDLLEPAAGGILRHGGHSRAGHEPSPRPSSKPTATTGGGHGNALHGI